MDDTEFWSLIDQVDHADRVDPRFTHALSVRLARLPIPRIVAFHVLAMDKCDQLLNWELWEAAGIIHQGQSVSEDRFVDFRLWVIAQGERTFNDALDDPDLLAEHPALVRLAGKGCGSPDMESMLGVAEMAFDQVLAKLHPAYRERVEYPEELDRRPREIPYPAPPPKIGDAQRVRALYPQLVELFTPAVVAPPSLAR